MQSPLHAISDPRECSPDFSVLSGTADLTHIASDKDDGGSSHGVHHRQAQAAIENYQNLSVRPRPFYPSMGSSALQCCQGDIVTMVTDVRLLILKTSYGCGMKTLQCILTRRGVHHHGTRLLHLIT